MIKLVRIVGSVAALIAAVAPFDLAGQTVGLVQWTHVPPSRTHSVLGDHLVDLDGDGRNEVVRVVRGSQSAGLMVMEFAQDGSLSVVGLAAGYWTDVLSMAVVPRVGLPASIIVTVRADPFQVKSLELAGKALGKVRDMPWTSRQRIRAVADVDGDGMLETLSASDSAISALLIADYATGALERSIAFEARSVEPAQLDGDPALELILAYEGTLSPGLIVDGATGEEEWSYPAGFRAGARAGRLSADPLLRTFIAPAPASTPIFSGAPYGIVQEFPFTVGLGESALLDIDNDGIDEVFFTAFGPALRWLDPVSGAITDYGTARQYDLPANVGRIAPDDAAVALISPEEISGGGFRVVDIGSGAELHSEVAETGPHTGAVFFDPEGLGTERIVLVNQIGSLGQEQVSITVLDAVTGAVLDRSTLAQGLGFSFRFSPLDLAVGNFDGLPGDEIALSVSERSTVMLDGRTLAERWRLDEPGNRKVYPNVVAADVDGDGRADLLQVYQESTWPQPLLGLRALAGATGAPIWDTGPVLTSIGLDLRVGDFDEVPGLEVLSASSTVRAFDAGTGAAKWEIAPVATPLTLKGLTTWGVGPDCRIGLLLGGTTGHSNRMQTFRCADRSVEATHWIPEGTQSMQALDGQGSQWAMNAAGQIWLGGPGATSTPVSDQYETSFAVASRGRAVRTGPGYVDMLFGSGLRLIRYRIADDRLFADRFEAL